MLVHGRYAGRYALITKLGQLFCLGTTLNRLGLGVTATVHELFCYVSTWVYVAYFVHRDRGQRSETKHFFLWQKAALV